MAEALRTVWVDPVGRLWTLDQTRLPFARVPIELVDAAACEHAIATMQVRGAPLIGVVAAYGLALALRADPGDAALACAHARLLATRPTAVNLRWALDRLAAAVRPLPPAARAAQAWVEAARLSDEDVRCNERIGEAGAAWLQPLVRSARERQQPLQLLTHCNAGALATVAIGTALAPVYRLHALGVPLHVWVDETRPRNQGAALTAWELAQAGIAHTLVSDNAGGLLMMQGRVDAVIVGCDRVAANGDVVNKIGTYLKALAARAHDVPVLVACPTSTIDPAVARGADVEIEERSPDEVIWVHGQDRAGTPASVRIAPPATCATNPAFDITPAALVTILLTERGPCAPTRQALRALLSTSTGPAVSPPQPAPADPAASNGSPDGAAT